MIPSKLPQQGMSIFATMTALAQQHDAINLAQGFPDFDPPQALRDAITAAMNAGYNQYAPMPGLLSLRERIAQKIGTCYGVHLDPHNEITITAGATQGIYCAIQAMVQPGDEVIILEPAYDSYAPAIRLAGGIPVGIPLASPDFRPDWDRIRSKVTRQTRLIIINNPHNPVGTVWNRDDIDQLRDIILYHGLLLISDEVYEHLVYDNETHCSVLSDPSLYARSFVTFSFGKTFHGTGWKIGYIIGPPALTARYRQIHQFMVFSVHTPSQAGLATYMEQQEVWRDLSGFYQRKRDFFLESIRPSAFKPLICEGTYFALLDYSDISDDDDITFTRQYTERCGVAMIPLSPFYSAGKSDSRLVRVCFAKTEELLASAAGRINEGDYCVIRSS